MFNSVIYKIKTSGYLRCFLTFALILVLSGCDKIAGGDKNYEVQSQCWQTKVISAILRIINQLYKRSSDFVSAQAMSEGGAAVICIAFAIWLAFRVLKTLSSLKEENLGEVWTEIGQKLFVCAFCMYLVYNTQNINWAIQTFVLPVYNTILELGLRIIKGTSSASGQDLGEFGALSYSSKYNYSTCEIGDAVSGNELHLKESITPMANCLVCSISDRLNMGIKIGLKLIFSLRLSAILVGLIVVFLFIAAKFSFVFFIIDGLFRLNFAVFLMPILIICIPFSYTRKWSKHCFLMFLNSAGIMMFMGLLVVVAVASLEIIVGAINKPGAILGFAIKNIEGFGPVLLSILFVAFMLVNVPGLAVALADKFIGGGGSDAFQKKVTKFVMETAKKIGAGILGSVTSNASKIMTNTLEKYEQTREALDTVRNIRDKVVSAKNSAAGYNND